MAMRIGYKASAEQFGPRELLDFSVLAEERGMDVVAVSDHFQPWRHRGGHGPAAMPWLAALGEASSHVTIGTSVLTPTLRYHPSIVAQAFATLGSLSPSRVFLGVGSGEAMNETPATGQQFPDRKERRLRLAEAIELIRLLWQEERVDFKGDYYEVARATIYDRPEQPIPIFIAAAGPMAAELAGRAGDGFICTSGKDPDLYRTLLDAMTKGATAAGRDPSAVRRMIEIKVSYDRDAEYAREACGWWAALALTPEQKEGIEDPVEMERVADASAHRAHTRFIVSSDPEEVIERIGGYVELGFDDLILHAPGADQARFIEQFSEDVMPALRPAAALARLRYVTELLVWLGGHGTWSEAMVTEQIDDSSNAKVMADLAQAEEHGLLERNERGLRLTDLGWRVAQGMGDALRAESAPERTERLKAIAETETPGLAATGDTVRYLAEVLVWIGGDGLWTEEIVVESIDPGHRSRVLRDLDLAEQAGVIERKPGGIRLTDRGWKLAADELE